MRIDFLHHPQTNPQPDQGAGNPGPHPPVPGYPDRARVSIPVPLLGQEVGAGQLVHGITNWLGIKQCGGCERREAELNRALRFRPMTGIAVRWDD